MSLNNVLLIGRLTANCEVRKTQSGKSVGNFTLAVTRERQKDVTDFIPIVLWGQTADFIGQYAHKGDMVAVNGSIQVRNYERDGQKVYVTEVHSMDTAILSHVESNKQKNDLPPIPRRDRADNSAPVAQGGYENPNSRFMSGIDVDDSDLPF